MRKVLSNVTLNLFQGFQVLLLVGLASSFWFTPFPCGTVVAQEWVARYNGPGNGWDWANAIAVDGSGNVYVTGWSDGSGTGRDYATVKYTPAGDTAWVRRFNGPGNARDEANAIAVDAAGYVYVTGESYGSGTNYDYATVKYTPAGDTAWVRRFNGPYNNNDGAYAIAVDGSGYVYVTGYSNGVGTGPDYATIKYTPSGDTAWVARYNGPVNATDYAYAIAVDASGYVYVTGYSYGSGTSRDYATVKYTPAGDTAWVRRYNGPGNDWDEAYAIAVDGSGNVYVTGYSAGSGTYYDYATIKYSPTGDAVWVRRFNGPGNSGDKAYAIAVDGSGYVYVTGGSIGSGANYDYATIKYNSAGDTAWVRRYSGPGNGDDLAYAIAVDAAGYVYVTGYSKGSGTESDYATIKYSPSGDTLWLRRYNGPGNGGDVATAIAVDGAGYVYVTGKSVGAGTSYDYATIKYSGEGGVEEILNRVQNNRLEVYPNPAHSAVSIQYSVVKPGQVSLKVYDICGKLVMTLVNEPKSAGTYTVKWDGADVHGKKLASGIYFYCLESGVYTATRKLTILK